MKYIIKPKNNKNWNCYCSDCNDCSDCDNCNVYNPCNVCKAFCGAVI